MDSPLGEPALRPEPGLRLRRPGRHHEVRRDADNESEHALDEEQVSPSRFAADSAKLKKPSCDESSRDLSEVVGYPEPRKTNRH